MTNLKKFFKDESGATAIEYGLMAALIGIGAIVGMGVLGDALDKLFSDSAAKLVI